MQPAPRSPASRIDFDHWSQLAKTDPETFERERSAVLDACIARASHDHQDRLRRLQWRIDRIRETAGTPMAACMRISDLMWRTFHQLGDAYRQLATDDPRPPRRATVLRFPGTDH